MKIAFLFLIKNEINHSELWQNFFENNEDKYNIYIHNKNPITNSFFNQFIIPENIETEWGKISIVKATLLLLKYALNDKENKRFILVD